MTVATEPKRTGVGDSARSEADVRGSKFILFDDMDQHDGSTDLSAWEGLNGGTSGSLSIPSTAEASHPGTASLNTGGTATGRITINRPPAKLAVGVGKIIFEACVKAVNLSDGSESFDAWIGLSNTTGDPTAKTDGIYFYYDHNTSANWLLRCEKDDTITTLDTGIPVLADTYQVLRFEVNAAGTSVQAYIGSLSTNVAPVGAPITTNIPVGVTDLIYPFASLLKSVGTTNRLFRMDYVHVEADIAR